MIMDLMFLFLTCISLAVALGCGFGLNRLEQMTMDYLDKYKVYIDNTVGSLIERIDHNDRKNHKTLVLEKPIRNSDTNQNHTHKLLVKERLVERLIIREDKDLTRYLVVLDDKEQKKEVTVEVTEECYYKLLEKFKENGL